MLQKTIIFISIIIVVVLGVVFYIKGAPTDMSQPSQNLEKRVIVSPDEAKKILDKLSGKSEVKATLSERVNTLDAITASSSVENSSTNSKLPSEAERIKILDSLSK